MAPGDWIAVDIGANEGKILAWLIRYFPGVRHWAFEPVPALFEKLQSRFGDQARIEQLALSDRQGMIQFNEVLSDPAYSGILKRPYPSPMKDRSILVKTDRLDALLQKDQQIGLIKMDVEGAEWLVLQGAMETILRCKPLIFLNAAKQAVILMDTLRMICTNYFRTNALTKFLR